MENPKQPFLSSPSSKGGLWTLPFILANEAFERLASYGLLPNMILYLMREYGMQLSTGTNLLFFWSAATNFTPFLCAILADSYVGRFHMIGFGCIISLLGMVLLWCTSLFSEARPSCYQQPTMSCSATIPQLILLCSSFALMSIGAGGMRSSSLAFGADQILDVEANTLRTKPPGCGDSGRLLESFLNWYYVSITSSILVAMTCIVYIQDRYGWKVGFGVPVVLMLISALSFFLASPYYVKMGAKTTLFSGLGQVVIAWWKKRNMYSSSHGSDGPVLYHCANGSTPSIPSDKLSFLNKACIITSPEMDHVQSSTSSSTNQWYMCTVDQVEELKALIKVIPLWSTGIMLCINISQSSFRLVQANTMDRHLFGFEIPAGSFGTFSLISSTLWIALYDRLILPIASKLARKPVHLGAKTRMGIGLFLSFASMFVSALVERCRRERAINIYDQGEAAMSALWLVPQHCLFGLAEAVNIIAQNEFFYSEFPRSMSSIASTLFGLEMAVASLVSSLIVSTVDRVTGGCGRVSWVSSNVNEGHYDYYYWLLAALTLLNLLYFLACSRSYGPYGGQQNKGSLEDDVVEG